MIIVSLITLVLAHNERNNSSVLVLNTFAPNNTALLVNVNTANASPLLSFALDTDTEVFASCSITFQNRFYVFGGATETRQVSQVAQCRLKQIGKLDFDFQNGACTTG